MNRTHTFDMAHAPERASKHWKQGKITWGALVDLVSGTPSRKKESGNYLLGKLRMTPSCAACRKKGMEVCLTRTNAAVVTRSAIMLDADTPGPDFLDDVELSLTGTTYLWHTTYSSAPDQPRYRLIIPTDREMTPEEFASLSRAIMQRIGPDNFDLSCDEPARYMFKPSAQQPGWYEHGMQDGEPLSVTETLKGFKDDLSARPFPKPHSDKRDPYTLDGVIGEFNEAYRDDLQGLIETYELPYVAAGSDRWQLVGSRSQAGFGEIEAGLGLYYSYHANDPAYGQTCSAFDLVRIHRFGGADTDVAPNTPVNRRPSHEEMLKLAAMDARVLNAEFEELDDDDKWQFDLDRNKRTNEVKPDVRNRRLIRDNDPLFQSLRYNEITFSVESEQDFPWRVLDETGGPVVTEADRGEYIDHLEATYGLKLPSSVVDRMVDSAARQRWYNPIASYLKELVWDGTPRLETCLPSVGTPSEYTRLVLRKSLVAAVARALDPGVKWDHTLVIQGPQGLGKSFWVETMSRGWFGQLGPLNDKDTLLAMQRSWIMTSDEAHTLRRADSEQQKEFLTRTQDVFRLPYERTTRAHPRRCVIWGTVNDEVFLRQQEGNRRFLVIKCEGRLDFARFTADYVDQVWAEAVALYHAGERLYLTEKESELVAPITEKHVEEDTLEGRLIAYLDDPEDPRREVCTTELWEHALGNFSLEAPTTRLRELFAAMKKLPGWELQPGKKRIGSYGPQRWFARTSSAADDFSEVL